jgi:N-acetylmuramoyl-L-alanine amidase
VADRPPVRRSAADPWEGVWDDPARAGRPAPDGRHRSLPAERDEPAGWESPVAGPRSTEPMARPSLARFLETDGDASPTGGRRRLTEAERRELRERRLRATGRLPEPSFDPRDDEAAHLAAPLPAPEASRGGGRAVVLGALLFVGMAAVWMGGDFLGVGQTEATATASPTAPVAVRTTVVPAGASPAFAGPVSVVCLDAGHGGVDYGYIRPAAGPLPAMEEVDFVLAQTWDLADRLRDSGVRVVMTRTSPNAVNAAGADVNGDGATIADSPRAGELDELQARLDVCNGADADLLVSLHLNGTDRNPDARGYETWYTGCRPALGERSARFASLTFEALRRELEAAGYDGPGREVNDDCVVSPLAAEPGLQEHMVMTGPDVPRDRIVGSTMPGAIVESLFLSNDADAAFLATQAGHDAIVAAYEDAILAYFAEFPG